jgi:hypothetical protein
MPYLDDGGTLADYNFTLPAHNITEAIFSITDWFNQVEGYDKSYIYDQINQNLY